MKTICRALIAGMLIAMIAIGVACAMAESDSAQTKVAVLRGVVVDAETGLPEPCTVAIIDSKGRTVLESEGFKDGFRCDGRFEKQLPPGRTRVRVTRGFEVVAEERTVELARGREVRMEFRLKRRVDVRRRGWFAGDSHAHMIHGENKLPVDFNDVALAAKAEDLQFLSLAQAWSMENPTPEKLEAELSRRSSPDCALTWNMEAPKNYYRGDAGRCLGHCWTLGLRGRTGSGRDAISLLMEASAHDYESAKPGFANFESHQFIHEQGGAVFYSHPARWWTGPWGGQGGYAKQENMRISNMAVELPLDTLIGPTYDGLDVMTSSGELQANGLAFDLWCLLLNHGWRVAATASSDSCFDRPGGATPGDVRTYAYLEGGFSFPAVAKATALGRTFVTSGPLLLAALEKQPPGSSFAADGHKRTLTLEAWASGADDQGLGKMEVLRNGVLFWSNQWSQPCLSAKTNIVITEDQNAWYCARVFGTGARQPRAISGAFYFESKPYEPPAPIPASVRVSLVDRQSGAKLSGKVTEVFFKASLQSDGKSHAITGGEGELTTPAIARLRAEVPGYEPLCLSPFLDNPELLNTITGLKAEDLVKWVTFERVRALLGRVQLEFQLQRKP